MATLNSWQKLNRVIPGQPFGSGINGAYSSASLPTLTKLSVSGVATETHFHASAGTFVTNDIVILHQTRGTDVGQWEVNRIVSDNSDGTYTLVTGLKYTYTDSGASQAQVIKIPQYTNFTLTSGTSSVTDWAGNTGGILIVAANGTASIAGTVNASSLGYDGGPGGIGSTGVASGEGTQGPVLPYPNNLNLTHGSGGGSGYGGGGGGNASSGGNGTGSWDPGQGGIAAGSADLITMVLGGGGGSGASANEYDGDGGFGGGIVIIMANSITVTGAINSNGSAGETSPPVPHGTGGGGGAGGSILLVCQTASLGTNLLNATGGAAGGGANADDYGGAGSVGRIAVHHSGTVVGTTNPVYTDVEDTSLTGGSSVGVCE